MDLQLRDRVYLVTGGSRGLGRATVDALVADGARCVVSSRSEETLAEVASAYGDAVRTVAADNADVETPGRLITAAQEAWGRVDGALISVGGPPAGPATAMSDDAWSGAFESVFLGAVRLAREVGAVLGSGGSMAFVLSTSVKAPVAGLSISNGLRPGLAMLAKNFADELGPRGIRVNGLLPGQIFTDRMKELTGAASAEEAQVPRTIPMARFGEPEEFGRVAAFVLSPAASYLTGVMVPVDGGMTRSL
ncbi:SDR family oxidoreductase [Nocardioides insulae]|uniref:SDR family oxidoreductase n=1 Tax=Nocardioides insulae TaxID=394734 RepID=UPI00040E6DE6|nr:SDR family oxidoreductase [Nocardioides insulae]